MVLKSRSNSAQKILVSALTYGDDGGGYRLRSEVKTFISRWKGARKKLVITLKRWGSGVMVTLLKSITDTNVI